VEQDIVFYYSEEEDSIRTIVLETVEILYIMHFKNLVQVGIYTVNKLHALDCVRIQKQQVAVGVSLHITINRSVHTHIAQKEHSCM
jgi:hypothetical protein